MSNYTFVKELRWRGEVKIYRHNATGEHIAISRTFTSDRGDATMIFPFSIETDKVTNWGELYAGYGESHEVALMNYERDFANWAQD